ncbi:MAG TPA: hypothetical protein VHW00_14780 [Thermoanaerobaculia bacterium]|nr:hypothetical protein [Thermoanaerobaculia bacterium]
MDQHSRDRNDHSDRVDRRPDPARNYDHDRDDVRGRDFGWRGTELDRGFGDRYDHDNDARDPDRSHEERRNESEER